MTLKRAVRRFQVNPKVTLVVEEYPGAVSTALGFWIHRGSRSEPRALSGATHLAEHMFFKGTRQHEADELSRLVEMHGGDVNAFTDREYTCFHSWIPAERTEVAFNVLTEMLYDSLFDAEEFDKEREVVAQEIRASEDSAEEEFLEGLWESPWGDHPLGRRVGGFSKQIRKLKRDRVESYVREQMLTAPQVVSVVGPLPAAEVLDLLKRALKRAEGMRWGSMIRKLCHAPRQAPPRFARTYHARSKLERFDSEQVHLGFQWPAVNITSPFEVHTSALSNMIGGGASSALFQEIREKRGLAYTVYAQYSSFLDAGLFSIVVQTDPKKVLEAAKVCGEICRAYAAGINDEEFRFSRGQLEGSTVLSFEGLHNRMESLGRQVLMLDQVYTFEKTRDEIRRMKKEEVEMIARGLSKTPCTFVLGPLKQRDLGKIVSAWEGKAR